jgi:hypothetical protein
VSDVAVTKTELESEFEYQQSLVRKYGAVIHAKTAEIEKLEGKISQQAREICKLSTESMYPFVLFMY